MAFKETMETIGKGVDAVGVGVIVVGATLATAVFIAHWARRREFHGTYRLYREGLGRAILLGLEFLVAADIIRTVAIEPTFQSVGVLAVIVLVRTFLSMSLELEIDGRWPWQRRAEAGGHHDA